MIRKIVLAGAAAAVLALTGCTAATHSTASGYTPNPMPTTTSQPDIPGVPTGCTVPPGYDSQQQVAYGTACTDQQGGIVSGDPSAWCRGHTDWNAAAPDTPAKLHTACMAGIKAGGGA